MFPFAIYEGENQMNINIKLLEIRFYDLTDGPLSELDLIIYR